MNGIFQVVRSQSSGRQVLGTAFLIFGGRVLTCAHVLGRRPDPTVPAGPFVMAEIGLYQSFMQGTIAGVEWALHPEFDIACGRVPAGIDAGEPLEIVTGSVSRGTEVTCVGFPSAASEVAHAFNRSIAADNSPRGLALDGYLAPGMSGGPALIEKKAVGVVYEDIVDQNLAFVVPLARISRWIEETFPPIFPTPAEPVLQQSQARPSGPAGPRNLGEVPIRPSIGPGDIPEEVFRVFARQFPDRDSARPFFLSAMKLRKDCNPEGFTENQILVGEDYLSWSKPPRFLWTDILCQSLAKSQRTLGAFFLAPGAPEPAFLSDGERRIFEEFRRALAS